MLSLAILLPGLHRVHRGAETAFESLSREIAHRDGWNLTLFGSGLPREGEPYNYRHVSSLPRERFESWKHFPPLRSETVWEELSFVRSLWRTYDPGAFDVTLTCSYPFLNWFLRYNRRRGLRKPRHIFVTQNGDWPCHRVNSEYRFFGCDGLICINPEYYEAHRNAYQCFLIPNGVDVHRFHPGASCLGEFDLPNDQPVVLMVSALIPSKRVLEGMRAVAELEEVRLVVAGDGPLRVQVEELGQQLMPGRFHRVSVDSSRMPDLYRSVATVLHMSVDEPFGNVYTESLATGLPIVAHDRRSTQWIVDDTSYLVDTRNLERVTQSLRSAINEHDGLKTAKRINLAKSRYSWQSIADQYCDALQAVLQD